MDQSYQSVAKTIHFTVLHRLQNLKKMNRSKVMAVRGVQQHVAWHSWRWILLCNNYNYPHTIGNLVEVFGAAENSLIPHQLLDTAFLDCWDVSSLLYCAGIETNADKFCYSENSTEWHMMHSFYFCSFSFGRSVNAIMWIPYYVATTFYLC